MNSEIPKFPVTDWEKLPMIVLEKTLEETKEKFAEYNSETQCVTEKSIKMLLGVVSFFSAMGGIISSRHPLGVINFIIMGIILLAFVYLMRRFYLIIKSRESYSNGTLPDYHITTDYDNKEFSEEDKKRLVYVNLTTSYMYVINKLQEINSKRAKKYDHNFFVGILFVIVTSLYVGWLMY